VQVSKALILSNQQRALNAGGVIPGLAELLTS
jgi:hypothetical protein